MPVFSSYSDVLSGCLSGMLVYVPTYIHNQSQVVVLFQSGAGIEVLENQGQMAARLYLPLHFMVRPERRGTLIRPSTPDENVQT